MAKVGPQLDVKGALRFVLRANSVDIMIMTCWRHCRISLAAEMDAPFCWRVVIDAQMIHMKNEPTDVCLVEFN